MHPNTFLHHYWGMDLAPKIFVAMSFSPKYDARYNEIIKPAIEGIKIDGNNLSAYRVDTSRSGDSIITDIMDGIANSQMIVADISTTGFDPDTGKTFRSSNVLYEVGIAHACRQPCEVLLIRDDENKTLFDVSVIPCLRIDFNNTHSAMHELRIAILERLEERKLGASQLCNEQ